MKAAILAMMLLLALAGIAMAQTLYRYTTSDGQVGYTDDPQHIPPGAIRQEEAMAPVPNAVTIQPNNITTLEEGMAAPLGDADRGHEVRFNTPLENNDPKRLMVPAIVRLNGHGKRLRLVYDTGAPDLVLNRKVAKALGLKAVRSVHGQLSDGANKRWVTESHAPVSIQIGPVVIDHVMATWIEEADYLGPPWDEDGLLGMDLISRFRTEVDHNRGLMHWTVVNRNNMRVLRSSS